MAYYKKPGYTKIFNLTDLDGIPSYLELKDSFRPWYLQAFINLSCALSISTILLVIILVTLFTGITAIIVYFAGLTSVMPDFWLSYLSGLSIIFFGLLFLYRAWLKHIQTLRYIKNLLVDSNQAHLVMKKFCLIYCSPMQAYIAIPLSLAGSLVILFIYPDSLAAIRFYLVFFGFICTCIAFFGVWTAVTSLIFLHKLINFKDLRINSLAPGHTIAFTRLSKLMSYYATLFTLEFSIAFIPFIYYSLTANIRIPPLDLNSFPYQFSLSLFIFFLIVSVPIYYTYPQWLIQDRIIQEKNKVIERIEDEVCLNFGSVDAIAEAQPADVEYYLELLNSVEKSRVSPRDLNSILRFAGSVIVSTIMVLLSQPIIFSRLAKALNSFITTFMLGV